MNKPYHRTRPTEAILFGIGRNQLTGRTRGVILNTVWRPWSSRFEDPHDPAEDQKLILSCAKCTRVSGCLRRENNQMNKCNIDQLGNWLVDQSIGWLIDWPTDCLIEWVIRWGKTTIDALHATNLHVWRITLFRVKNGSDGLTKSGNRSSLQIYRKWMKTDAYEVPDSYTNMYAVRNNHNVHEIRSPERMGLRKKSGWMTMRIGNRLQRRQCGRSGQPSAERVCQPLDRSLDQDKWTSCCSVDSTWMHIGWRCRPVQCKPKKLF